MIDLSSISAGDAMILVVAILVVLWAVGLFVVPRLQKLPFRVIRLKKKSRHTPKKKKKSGRRSWQQVRR